MHVHVTAGDHEPTKRLLHVNAFPPLLHAPLLSTVEAVGGKRK